MNYDSKLDAVEQEIKALENSEEYKTLAKKNSVWFVHKATDEEKADWELLKEKLAKLEKDKEFYQKAILSSNAQAVKKADPIRKRYKKDTAIKDERLLLSTAARKRWQQFNYTLERKGKPTFGDLKRAAGFRGDEDVREYFEKRALGEIEKDDIKECMREDEWIFLITLNYRVNGLLQDELIANEDGSIRLVLEHDVYQAAAEVAENIVVDLYEGEKKVDVKDASSDSSGSP
ncbi:hypothetical protein MIR68_011811 [Amoeboaphelidium protococcarum]|nr:hypothetical protein MIR68_011811 [Amoeboaphelidium protococcarum]